MPINGGLPPSWLKDRRSSSGVILTPPGGKGKSQNHKNKNLYITINRARVTQQFLDVAGLGASNNRLRVTQQYAEVAGLGASNNRLRATQQYIEVVVKDLKGKSFAVII